MVKRLSNTDQNSQKITNIPTPINPYDAVNKEYVDNKTEGPTDAVKSSTTDRLTVSEVAPQNPSVGDVWVDETTFSEELAPSIIVWKETPIGTIDGFNFSYETRQPYVAGTLQVYINGLAQSEYVTESIPETGDFYLSEPPIVGDKITVQYQAKSVALGNAQSLGNVTLTTLLESLYPIGSVYISGEPIMPILIQNIGTWQSLDGRVIVGVDSSQVEFSDVNKIGGAKSHTLTVSEMPSHNHKFKYGNSDWNDGYTGNINTAGGLRWTAGFDNYGAGNIKIGHTGDNQPHNNLQPYKTKFMWERVS